MAEQPIQSDKMSEEVLSTLKRIEALLSRLSVDAIPGKPMNGVLAIKPDWKPHN